MKKALEVFDIELESLKSIRNSLDGGFSSAVGIILQTLKNKGKIVVTGIGKNVHIAEKISATLNSTGSTSVPLNPIQAMHGDIGVLNEEDAVIALSYSGESEELNALIPAIKRLNIPVISITGNANSTLARHSKAVIIAKVKREACPFNMAPTSSTTAALVIGDALAMALLDARGFKKDDYAKLHPGGAIGRTLLSKVSDIMRTGERLATVSEAAKVKDAMLSMTKARSGSVGIVNAKGKLLGIFTDGDLRRHLYQDSNIINAYVSKVMTKSPTTVKPDALAAEVLNIFEEKNIDDIPVIDNKGKYIGNVDIQDLPKLKIL